MRKDSAAVELDIDSCSREELLSVEDRVNEIIREGRTVSWKYKDEALNLEEEDGRRENEKIKSGNVPVRVVRNYGGKKFVLK